MKLQYLSFAGLLALASAQGTNLTAALSSEPSLSNLTTFLGGLDGLAATLASLQNVTLLAPNNDAIAALLNSSQASILTANNTALVTALFSYHVINGTVNSSEIMEDPAFPPTILNNPQFSNVTGGQVVEAVKDGDKVMIFSGLRMNATVTKADIKFDGGIIHAIDSFLVPPQNLTTTGATLGLSSVVGAIEKAGITELVDTSSDLTVFAPNNDAFKSIGSILGNVSTDDLTKILGYHAIVGAPVLYSSALENGTFKTFNGANVTVTIEDNGDVFVNSAKVIQPDVLLSNGVLHVIDAVLNPAASTATPDPSASTQAPVFSGASSASDVPFTSGVPAASTTLAAAGGGATGGAGSSSSSSAFAMPKPTGAVGAVGAGVLFAVGGYLVV